jgi:hypothetical protein
MKNPTTPIFIGAKKIQVGKQAGIEIPGFILVRNASLKRMGMTKTGFPATVGGVSYALEGSEIVVKSSRTFGNKKREVTRTLAAQHCSKPITVYLKSNKVTKVKRQGKTLTVVRRNKLQVGYPDWAGVREIRRHLSTAGNVHSFSFGGGTHLVTFAGGR